MKKTIATILLLAILLALGGCTTPPEETQPPKQLDKSGKYYLDTERNEAIINDAGVVSTAVDGNARIYYQLFVGSFSDSNGDGIGDLRGVIDRFDYLNEGHVS